MKYLQLFKNNFPDTNPHHQESDRSDAFTFLGEIPDPGSDGEVNCNATKELAAAFKDEGGKVMKFATGSAFREECQKRNVLIKQAEK